MISQLKPRLMNTCDGAKENANVQTNSQIGLQVASIEPEEWTEILPDGRVPSYVVPENEPVENVDINDDAHQYDVSIYVEDVYKYLREMEKKYQPKQNYMKDQLYITPRMRAYIINWLVETHRLLSRSFECALQTDTLFLSINLFDRFLSRKSVAADRLQLLGLGCFYIASKFEETYYPSVDQLLQYAINGIRKEDVIRMERIVLNELSFGIGAPTSICFLKRFAKLALADSMIGMLSRFMAEYAMMSYSLSTNYCPSQIAAASISLALRIVGRAPWTATLQKQTGYTHDDLLPVLIELRDFVRKSPFIKKQAIFCKYADQRHLMAAIMAAQKV